MINADRFRAELILCYIRLFIDDPEYAYSAAHITPEALADKMTFGLARSTASKHSKGIWQTCQALSIPYTYKAIRAYLLEEK